MHDEAGEESAEAGLGRSEAELVAAVYKNLKAIAARYLDGRAGLLQTTALVHEACAKLLGGEGRWRDEAHVLAVGARAVRQVLVDELRRRKALKRAAHATISLAEPLRAAGGADLDVLAVDEMLQRLAELDPRQHQIVEMKFFAGMTIEQIAAVTGLSTATVEREWRAARAWLASRLEPGSGP